MLILKPCPRSSEPESGGVAHDSVLVTQAGSVFSNPSPADTYTLWCRSPGPPAPVIHAPVHACLQSLMACAHTGAARLPEGPLQQRPSLPAQRTTAAASIQAGFTAAPGQGPRLPAQCVSACPPLSIPPPPPPHSSDLTYQLGVGGGPCPSCPSWLSGEGLTWTWG